MYFILSIISAILNAMLFWKIWEMTSDVTQIKNLLYELSKPKAEAPDSSHPFSVGQVVVLLATEDQMKVKEIEGDKYVCYTGMKLHGKYSANEIEDFKTYWDKKK